MLVRQAGMLFSRCSRAAPVLLVLVCHVAAEPLRPVRVDVAGVSFDLVQIPPGSFRMGSETGHGDERPVRQVTIDYSFDMGRTEVTVAQFRAFVDATGYRTVAEREGSAWHFAGPDQMGWKRGLSWRDPGFAQTDDEPVVCISHIDATAFCQWLSQETGKRFRLPSEAEWEYACRAGTAGDYAGEVGGMAWYSTNCRTGPRPVARKAPNAWGLYDMHGNAAEWCDDLYHWHYRDASTDGSAYMVPQVPAPVAARRVLRGGAWCEPAEVCRVSFRRPVHGFHRGAGTGFRLVCCDRPAKRDAVSRARPERARHARGREADLPSKVTLTVAGVEFDFVRIDGGAFRMGSPFRYVDRYNWTYEMPVHEVSIDYSYYLGTT